MRALCQICGEFVAIVELDTLRYPVTASMFTSPDPVHGFPDPFNAGQQWEDMRCPYGRIHRIMIEDDKVLTHKGIICLPRDGGPAYMADAADTVEVGRNSIGDKILVVSDERAEEIAREELEKSFPSEPPEDDKEWICQECGKVFPTIRAMRGHMAAHKATKRRKR